MSRALRAHTPPLLVVLDTHDFLFPPISFSSLAGLSGLNRCCLCTAFAFSLLFFYDVFPPPSAMLTTPNQSPRVFPLPLPRASFFHRKGSFEKRSPPPVVERIPLSSFLTNRGFLELERPPSFPFPPPPFELPFPEEAIAAPFNRRKERWFL